MNYIPSYDHPKMILVYCDDFIEMTRQETPKGLYFSHFLNEAAQKAIMTSIDGAKWRSDLERRTQHYGARYDYKTRKLVYDVPPIKGSPVEACVELIKDNFESIIGGKEVITSSDSFDSSNSSNKVPIIDQVIVNEYTPGQKIQPHIDHVKLFGPVVITVTLLSSAPMTFSRNGYSSFVVSPGCGDVVILSDESRYLWKHGIDGVKKRRVSVTCRSIL